MNIKLQKVSNKILMILLFIFSTFCMLSFNTIKVSAHDAYYLAIVYDTN